MADRRAAEEANQYGRVYAGEGLDERAEQWYRKAIDLDPEYEHAWFNLGLVYKGRRDWANCARCNLRAAELDPRQKQPAWWNLGIAATALRDWDLARKAWTGFGVELPQGSGPIEGSFGYAPVRINPDTEPEVIWARRIDPARAVIDLVPFPESGHHFGDIVLHDGEPKGERELDGRIHPVFDEIELWQPSGTPTTVAELSCPAESDAEAAIALFGAAGVPAEDWVGSVRMLCKACSEGRAHGRHDGAGPPGWQVERSFGFAAGVDTVRPLLERWQSERRGRRASVLED